KRTMIAVIRKQVIGIVMQNSMDPRTKLPHTRDRIEWAFNEAKVKVDFRPAREQVEGVLKEIRLVLPISFGTSKLQVIVPARYAPSAYGKIRGMGKLLKEQWLGNGSLEVTLEVPSGLKIDIMTELGDLTKGEAMVTEKQV
ncbi:MAG: ribosome assembly factor SBDS, partial [Candidatus Altiarchaeota archaeon]|nr:ribosome assembly factor SBDS [Candidatus Altiarchaeota archaeon]